MLLPGKMCEQISSLDFQTDEKNFDTEWKWNIVSEEMEKKFETFYTVSNERFIKAGPMICTNISNIADFNLTLPIAFSRVF